MKQHFNPDALEARQAAFEQTEPRYCCSKKPELGYYLGTVEGKQIQSIEEHYICKVCGRSLGPKAISPIELEEIYCKPLRPIKKADDLGVSEDHRPVLEGTRILSHH